MKVGGWAEFATECCHDVNGIIVQRSGYDIKMHWRKVMVVIKTYAKDLNPTVKDPFATIGK